MVGQDVDRKVQPGTRAVPADRCGSHDDASEVVAFVFPQQRFAHALEFVVKRKRYERMLFRDVRRVGYAVHGTRRAIDELLHAGLLRRNHHRLEAVVVDRLRQFLVEFEACIIGNAGKMQDRILSRAGFGEFRGIANVALYDAQLWIVRQAAAEIEYVIYRYGMACGEKAWS